MLARWKFSSTLMLTQERWLQLEHTSQNNPWSLFATSLSQMWQASNPGPGFDSISPEISKHNSTLIFSEDGATLEGRILRSTLGASENGTQCSQQEGFKSQWSSGLIDGGLGASTEATERKKWRRNTSKNTVLNMALAALHFVKLPRILSNFFLENIGNS